MDEVYSLLGDAYHVRITLHRLKADGVLARIPEADRDSVARCLERLVKEIRG